MRRAVTVLLALMLAACAVPQDQSASPQDLPPLAARHGEPLLALADHVLAVYFASQTGTGPTVCLATSDGREPVAMAPEAERALMMRHTRLSPKSACVQQDGGWVDADSGEPALVFTLDGLSCPEADRCTAFAGYGAGAQQAAAERYDLIWRGDGWTITRVAARP